MTDDEKCKAIADYTRKAVAHIGRKFDSPEEQRESLQAVQKEKQTLMKTLREDYGR